MKQQTGTYTPFQNEQPRETGNIGYYHKTKHIYKKHNTICVGHHYVHINKTNINKT